MRSEIKNLLSSALTVRELIEYLENCDQDAPVLISSDYGDRGNTEQVTALTGENVTEADQLGGLYTTAYSSSGVAVGEDGEEEGNILTPIPVILRG